MRKINENELTSDVFNMFGKEWAVITAEKDGKVNAMTASWGGVGVLFGVNVAFIFVRPQRYTKEFIDGSDSFSLCFFDEEYRAMLNYLGSASGRDEDKIAKSNLTVAHSEGAPYFNEAHKVITCEKIYVQDMNKESFVNQSFLKVYPKDDFHTLYVGRITGILEQ